MPRRVSRVFPQAASESCRRHESLEQEKRLAVEREEGRLKALQRETQQTGQRLREEQARLAEAADRLRSTLVEKDLAEKGALSCPGAAEESGRSGHTIPRPNVIFTYIQTGAPTAMT
jgi:hypothetical protein